MNRIDSALSNSRKLAIVVIILILVASAGVGVYYATRSSTPKHSPSTSSAESTSSATSLSSLNGESSTSPSGTTTNASFTLDLLTGTLTTGNDILNRLQNLLGNPTVTNLIFDPSGDEIYAIDTDQEMLTLNAATGSLVSVAALPAFSTTATASATIYTGKYAVLDSSNGDLYATSFSNYANEENEYTPTNVTVISTASDAVIANIVIGGNTSSTGTAIGIAFDNSTNQVFVAMENSALGSAYVAIVDASNNTLAGTISLGGDASGIAYDSINGNVYVSQHFSNSIVGINPLTRQVVSNMSFSFCTLFCTQFEGPSALYFNQGSLYAIASPYSPIANISAIDPSTSAVTANFSIPAGYVNSLAFGNGEIFAMGAESISNVTSGASGSGTTIFEISSSSNYSVAASVYVGAGVNPAMALADSVLFVGDGLYSSVDVVNAASFSIAGSIPIAFDPGPIALDMSNGNLYVGNELANDVAAVNGSTNKVETYIMVPSVPSVLEWDDLNSYLYLLTNAENSALSSYSSLGANGTNDVTVIDCATNSIANVIPVGQDPTDLTIDFYNDQISVADYGLTNSTTGNLTGSGVTIVNGGTNSVSHFTGLLGAPDGIIFDPYVGDVFTQYWNSFGNMTGVAAINDTTGSLIATIPLGSYPAYGADPPQIPNLSPSSDGTIFDSQISGIPTPQNFILNQLTGSPCYDEAVKLIPITPYTSQAQKQFLLSLRQTLETVCAQDSDDEFMQEFQQFVQSYLQTIGGDDFVANPLTNSVADINDTSNTIRNNITLDTSPFEGMYVSSSHSLYFLDYGSPSITVVNSISDNVVSTIDVGLDPVSLQYDNATNQLFISNMGDGTVSIINVATNQVSGLVNVGALPGNEVYDPLNGNLYVSNMGSGTLSIILSNNS